MWWLAGLTLALVVFVSRAFAAGVGGVSYVYLPAVIDSNPALAEPTAVPNGYIANPGFEAGETGWTFNWNTAARVVSTLQSHGGTKSAMLGDGSVNRKAAITQNLLVPQDLTQLTFYTYTEADDQEECLTDPEPGNGIGDFLLVHLNNQRIVFWQVCYTAGPSWQARTLDLSAYQGQQVFLNIQYVSDATFWSKAFLDDFQFSAP